MLNTKISVANLITGYMHCGVCLQEIADGTAGTNSPKEYARIQTGITSDGRIQVWCNRHDLNVAMFDSAQDFTGKSMCDVPGCEHNH